MVSHRDKKLSSPIRKRKAGVVEALLADPIDISATKAEKAAIKNLRSTRNSSVISAFVYDKNTQATPPKSPPQGHHKNPVGPITVSVFTQKPANLTFTTKLRNVIHYVFESLRDTVALSTPPSSDITKSILEMRSLNGSSENILNEEIKRHLVELIEETEAFVHGEKTKLTGVSDFQSVLHYRHYVRIAWLSQFILSNLAGPVIGRSLKKPSANFPPNS